MLTPGWARSYSRARDRGHRSIPSMLHGTHIRRLTASNSGYGHSARLDGGGLPVHVSGDGVRDVLRHRPGGEGVENLLDLMALEHQLRQRAGVQAGADRDAPVAGDPARQACAVFLRSPPDTPPD